ncbi:MAG: ScyD/ScyE family protein [Ilumatobacteraceae bacterium]
MATDLIGPKGLALDLAGNPVIAQGFSMDPTVVGPVLVYAVKGKDRGTLTPVTDDFQLADVAISPLDGTGWAIATDLVLYHQLEDGTIEPVLDLAAYQAGDPDPVDQDDPPFPEESNPYGLTVAPDGDALVADAAGNDVIRVTPDGDAETVARFGLQEVATDHLPPEFGLPPVITAEAVPTTVTIGPDGAIYVGELKGFPFRPGTSHVWRIEPDAVDAECTVGVDDADCTVYRDGFTAIQDIAFSPKNGNLFVYELAKDGVLAFEAGFESGDFPAAVLLEDRGGRRPIELVKGELSQPGGIVVGGDGKIYVTDGIFGNGRLSRVRT